MGLTVRARAIAAGLLVAAGVVALVFALAGLRADDRASADTPENPVAQETKHYFVNDTGVAASDLHIEFTVPVEKPIVAIKGGACPPPNILSDGSPLVDIDWGEKCVEPDGLMIVSVIVFSKAGPDEVGVVSVTWTNNGTPIGLTPEPIETDSPTTGTPPVLATAPSDDPTSTPILPPTVVVPPTPFPGVPPVPTSTVVPGPGPLPTTAFTPTSTVAQGSPTTPTVTATLATSPSLGRGDVNCDQNVNSIDAALVLQLIAGLLSALDCEDDADVNQNGVVDSIDVAIMLQFIAGLVARLPV